MRDHLVPIAWIIVGLTIISDPDGRVLLMRFRFGEYKYLAGFCFVLVGLFFWRKIDKGRGGG